MKNKIWLFQIPVIILFSGFYYILVLGTQGKLNHTFLREKVFPPLRTLSGMVTDYKFHNRGAEPAKNKIVIVEIDDEALSEIGRWPWHRDDLAYLLGTILQFKPKAVGLDIVFSEPDTRVSPLVKEVLTKNKLESIIAEAETDRYLGEVIRAYSNQVVLGWIANDPCQPKYSTPDAPCDPLSPELTDLFLDKREDGNPVENSLKDYSKFSFTKFLESPGFDPRKTPALSARGLTTNLPEYNAVAKHAGLFVVAPDTDNVIRRTSLLYFVNGKPYPSLALEMARVGKDEDLEVSFNQNGLIEKLGFSKSGDLINTSPLGAMDINFRGPSYHFRYVPAMNVVREAEEFEVQVGRSLATEKITKTDLFKDAYVFLGVSAIGANDIRQFPMDRMTPGVEGHASILDNLLHGDELVSEVNSGNWILVLFFMSVGVALFAMFTERLEAVGAFFLFAGMMIGTYFLDFQILFANKFGLRTFFGFESPANWNTAPFYIELMVVFGTTMLAKYILEERQKQQLKESFGLYVSPALVHEMSKDPSKKPTLEGQKADLSILFSDVRGFTTLSENLEPKALANFLNDYLTSMNEIIFKYHGTVDKYIGDAIMAFWGAPISDSRNAFHSCISAIEMMQSLRKMKPFFRDKYGIEVDVGAGINSGPVSVGNMGSKTKMNYTVLGDNVNLASRLEGLTKPYHASILTTRQTIDRISPEDLKQLPHRTLDFVKVKGKTQAVELVQLLEQPLNPQGLSLFYEARALYVSQKWDNAIEAFGEANKKLRESLAGDDGPTLEFISRCKDFKQDPPKPDWDGSWKMETK